MPGLPDSEKPWVARLGIGSGLDIRCPNPMHELDRWPRVIDSESAPGKRFFIDPRVEIAEAFREFHLFAIDDDRAERADLSRFGAEWKVGRIDRQEPADARSLKLDESRHLPPAGRVDDACLCIAEKPPQKIKQMDTDVRGDSA